MTGSLRIKNTLFRFRLRLPQYHDYAATGEMITIDPLSILLEQNRLKCLFLGLA
jgi:hypothetical protein